MKRNIDSLIFFALILFNIQIYSKHILPVGDSSFYDILLAQMKLSTNAGQINGFARIISLLNDLVDTTSKSIKHYESQVKAISLNCSIQNITLTKNYQELLDLKANYTSQLNKIETIEVIEKRIRNATETRDRIIREKEIYTNTFKKVYADYLKFLEELKKAYPKVECIHTDFSKLLLYSVKPNLSFDDEMMKSMVQDDLKFCHSQIKSILVTIGELDDTELCKYREQLEINYKKFKNLDNFPIGINASLAINNTLNDMNAYYFSKHSNFTNANKTIFTYETQISNLNSLIINFENQLVSLVKLRETFITLLGNNEKAIISTVSLINLLKKQCVDEISILNSKISTANKEFKSYTDLKLYFTNNYSKLSQSFKNKYAGNPTPSKNNTSKTKLRKTK